MLLSPVCGESGSGSVRSGSVVPGSVGSGSVTALVAHGEAHAVGICFADFAVNDLLNSDAEIESVVLEEEFNAPLLGSIGPALCGALHHAYAEALGEVAQLLFAGHLDFDDTFDEGNAVLVKRDVFSRNAVVQNLELGILDAQVVDFELEGFLGRLLSPVSFTAMETGISTM